MNLKFYTFYLLFIVINILTLTNGAVAPDNKGSILKDSDINDQESKVEPQNGLESSGCLTTMIDSEILSSKYEANYLMEMIIIFLVRYLVFIVNFSAILNHKSYKLVYNEINYVASYLGSRSSYLNRSKMLFQSRAYELSEYIHKFVDIRLLSSLTTDSGQISKEAVSDISSISKRVVRTVSQIIRLLQELSYLEVDSSLKRTSKFLSKLSDSCLKMFKSCMCEYHKMSKKQFDALFASRVRAIPYSTILLELTNKFDYLSDMKKGFEDMIQMINAYNQFLETGKSSLTYGEIEETRSLIANLFENGDLGELDIFRQEELVLTSLEILGLAALNLSLFDRALFNILKSQVEEAYRSVNVMVNYRGTEIRLSQNVVFMIREETRTLMGYQELIGLDFTIMSLDNSLLESDLLHYVLHFYESLLRIYELVRREQSRNNDGKYIKILFSKIDPLFEKTLDNYKSIMLYLKQIQDQPKKASKQFKINRRATVRELSRMATQIDGRSRSKSSTRSTKKKRVSVDVSKSGLRKSSYSTTGEIDSKEVKRKQFSQLEKKIEKQLMARASSENARLSRVLRIMKSQSDHLVKMNHIEIVSILESILRILSNILASEGIFARESSVGPELSGIILGLRSIGDRTNYEHLYSDSSDLLTASNLEYSDSSSFYADKQEKGQGKYLDQSSEMKKKTRRKSKSSDDCSIQSKKSLISKKSKRRADEKVKPLGEAVSTVDLFGENPVFASRRHRSRVSPELDESDNLINKQKIDSKPHQSRTKRKLSSSGKIQHRKGKTHAEKPVKVISSRVASKKCERAQKKQHSHVKSPRSGDPASKKRRVNKRALLVVNPDVLGRKPTSTIASRYNIKSLNFSHISLNSPYNHIFQAITCCYNEIAYLYYEVYLFLSGIEKTALKQVMVQMIILLKNLIAVLIAKDRRKMRILRRNYR